MSYTKGSAGPGASIWASLPLTDGTTPKRIGTAPPSSDRASDPGTWTLVSFATDDGSMKVWHQHGTGTVPVPMQAASVSSARLPTLQGRCYVCPDCDDWTVVSLPVT